ncbi:flocculation protein FLO11-like isoform X1 [Arachis stenosperma]|uniref:flocculation protein FLO11-like isoform X1 n=1 Tax=Arachis stenosperma TaxID=217475 RepID=UPI0025ABACCA|nr:flocculation protein FLO11-like isoform X1 [Arachis stenosperma]
METTSHADLHQPPLTPASNLPVENGGPRESHLDDDRCAKKPKLEEHVDGGGGGGGGGGELKRVAEIVLVLSTMATMRAGRKPTDVEVELMREARSKLAELCVGLAPKDIVGREAIGTVIEDLGLNGRVRDQRLGFRTPKMSIAERYTHAKWKMEEAKRYAAPSTTYTSQPVQPSTSVTVDNRVAPHGVRVFPPDNSSHIAIPSSATTVSIPSHVSAGSSSTSQYQVTSNEVRPPMVSGAIPSTHLGRNSSPMVVPKLENPQVRADGGSNGSSYVLSIPANSSANQPLANAPPWSIQTQSASLARTALENKVPAHNTVKVQGTSDVASSRAGSQITADQSFRPFITQTAPVNLSTMQQSFQGMNVAQPPSIPTHAEIAKIVQKLLQPKLPEHPTWTPPSRDYMNKALTCQVCELTVNEVDTVLLCDACEKGYHLKCLQPSVLRGIHNRVDWHCMRCLNLSGGKPIPPKYGRVMRSSNTPPKLPTTVGVQQPSEKKTGSLDPKVSQQNLTTNGSTAPIVATSNVKVEPPSDSKTPGTKDIHGTGSSNTEHIDQKPDPNISMKSLNAASVPSIDFPGESSAQQINPEPSTCKESSTSKECFDSKTLPKLSEPGECDNLQSSQDFQAEQKVSQGNAVVLSDKKVDSSLMSNEQKESQSGESSTYDTKRDDQDVALANFDGSSGTNAEVRQHCALSSDSSQVVEWIGDVIHIVDEKKFYKSCCVDGVTYRLHSHALLPSGHGKLAPSKLQSMWEDCKTGLKWVKVTKCYFPGDLPGNIGHPCISEVNEVYESNSERTEKASSIRGPCEVLPSDKFNQENDRRNQLGIEANARIQPLFVCRWFYDEIKKLFQPVTS